MSVLNKYKVLVLNKGWNPIAVINLKKAMGLITKVEADGQPKAKILDASKEFQLFSWDDWATLIAKDDEPVIRSINKSFKIPEIILLTNHNKLPQQRTNFNRRTIYRRDNNTCQYCNSKPGVSLLSIDHVIPRSQGGKSTLENCVLACVTCNGKKANRTPEQARMKLLKQPTKPRFTLHKHEYHCESWEQVLGVMYWNVELENDNQ